ncbi:MAG TPA: CPBP family intramembrane glutamic endopeptidase, partial [Longimicrobiales bacterium]|nr:CPBP family intramembrane glutamic endopeptidase [Longimicrobiales bacterium]
MLALDRLLRTEGGRLRIGWRLLLFFVVAAAVWVLVASLRPADLLVTSTGLLVGSLVAGALLLRMDGRRPGALGFYLRPEAAVESLAGLVLGIAVGAAVVAAMAVVGAVRWAPEEGDAASWLAGGAGALLWLALPAAAEEALLRGYPLQSLAEAYGPWTALIATSVLFGVLHFLNPGIGPLGAANIALAGLLLGVVYLRTRSLWWASGAHVGWNWALGWLADVPVSGLELMDAPLYEGQPRGPAWLGGGAFGPEGSVVATVVVAAAAALCWRTPRLRPSRAALEARPLALARG